MNSCEEENNKELQVECYWISSEEEIPSSITNNSRISSLTFLARNSLLQKITIFGVLYFSEF